MVNIGRITGGYKYAPNINLNYPNLRKVEWLQHLSRENFTQAALYEIGSFISLIKVERHSMEFETAVNAPNSNTKSMGKFNDTHDDDVDDASVAQSVSFQAEETAQDFIIRRLKTSIDPYQFEEFTAHLLECLGCHARITAKSSDGGVDIIAHKDELGFEPPIIKIQCKQITSNIGRPDVQQLIGSVEQGEHALFVTLGGYTREARDYERSKSNLRLLYLE